MLANLYLIYISIFRLLVNRPEKIAYVCLHYFVCINLYLFTMKMILTALNSYGIEPGKRLSHFHLQ